MVSDQTAKELAEPAAWLAAKKHWPGVLDVEWEKPYFRNLRHFIDTERAAGREVYPTENDVFAAFQLTPYDNVKVVVLGQDPYPNPDQAMGLSFSVRAGTPLPASLRNIHAALRDDQFTPPPTGDLTGWATQGVLLLNAALTVERGDAGGHLDRWRPFTEAVIRSLNARPEPVVFVLWGRKAQRAKRQGLIDFDRHGLVEAPHPAARGAAQVEFRKAQTFTKTNRLLKEYGASPIRWEEA